MAQEFKFEQSGIMRKDIANSKGSQAVDWRLLGGRSVYELKEVIKRNAPLLDMSSTSRPGIENIRAAVETLNAIKELEGTPLHEKLNNRTWDISQIIDNVPRYNYFNDHLDAVKIVRKLSDPNYRLNALSPFLYNGTGESKLLALGMLKESAQTAVTELVVLELIRAIKAYEEPTANPGRTDGEKKKINLELRTLLGSLAEKVDKEYEFKDIMEYAEPDKAWRGVLKRLIEKNDSGAIVNLLDSDLREDRKKVVRKSLGRLVEKAGAGNNTYVEALHLLDLARHAEGELKQKISNRIGELMEDAGAGSIECCIPLMRDIIKWTPDNAENARAVIEKRWPELLSETKIRHSGDAFVEVIANSSAEVGLKVVDAYVNGMKGDSYNAAYFLKKMASETKESTVKDKIVDAVVKLALENDANEGILNIAESIKFGIKRMVEGRKQRRENLGTALIDIVDEPGT